MFIGSSIDDIPVIRKPRHALSVFTHALPIRLEVKTLVWGGEAVNVIGIFEILHRRAIVTSIGKDGIEIRQSRCNEHIVYKFLLTGVEPIMR